MYVCTYTCVCRRIYIFICMYVYHDIHLFPILPDIREASPLLGGSGDVATKARSSLMGLRAMIGIA